MRLIRVRNLRFTGPRNQPWKGSSRMTCGAAFARSQSTKELHAPCGNVETVTTVKKIGFLSFGHWSDSYGSEVRSASDSLLQSTELAVAAEHLGADGA